MNVFKVSSKIVIKLARLVLILIVIAKLVMLVNVPNVQIVFMYLNRIAYLVMRIVSCVMEKVLEIV